MIHLTDSTLGVAVVITQGIRIFILNLLAGGGGRSARRFFLCDSMCGLPAIFVGVSPRVLKAQLVVFFFGSVWPRSCLFYSAL